MTDIAMTAAADQVHSPKPKLDHPINPLSLILFFGVLAAGFLFVAYSLYVDVDETGAKVTTYLPFILLFIALVIALGFEFVNGFHDTANAVATVIYTHSLPAPIAVVWSGFFNFLGVLVSSGAVAFGIVSLLPVELILQVGSAAGFAMVFALLIAAIIWNLGTWYLGLPASSSHTLIGLILMKDKENDLSKDEAATLNTYKKSLDNATKFIPIWVKIAVAIALGLGTMIGWKRIVVTVGEKIGKSHLTYAQGASAELVAAATIAAADGYGLPVSTTPVLSSGVAGTMAANGSGLQMATVRNLLMGWVLTLPAAILLSATLYWTFSQVF